MRLTSNLRPEKECCKQRKGIVFDSSESERRSGESTRMCVTTRPKPDVNPGARAYGTEATRTLNRRHDAQKSHRNMVVKRKTRAMRQLRRYLYTKFPPAFRSEKQNAKIRAKPEASGKAYSLCTNIMVQSNAENPRQHFVHKHI